MALEFANDSLGHFLIAHADDLRHGGTIVNKFRSRQGRRFGPYPMLTCRDENGHQQSVYLAGEEKVARARAALATLQAPRRQAQVLARARQALRRGLRAAQVDLDRQLQEAGLYRHGTEIRGWSQLQNGIRVPVDVLDESSNAAALTSKSGKSKFC